MDAEPLDPNDNVLEEPKNSEEAVFDESVSGEATSNEPKETTSEELSVGKSSETRQVGIEKPNSGEEEMDEPVVSEDNLEQPGICPSGDSEQCFVSFEAKAEHNQSNNGLYKGVITGDYSGNVRLSIRNDDPEKMEATLAYNNASFELPIWEFYNNDGTIYYRIYASEYDFSVLIDEEGNVVQDSAILYGPNGEIATVSLFKETSDAMVEIFEGTFSGMASGIWNTVIIGNETINGFFIVSGGSMEGPTQAKKTPTSNEWTGEWGVANGSYTGTTQGYRDGDTIKGTWYINSMSSVGGEFLGTKTL